MNFMLETQRPGQSEPLRQKFFTRDAMIAAMKSLMKFHFVGHMEPFCKVEGRWELDSEALSLLTNQGIPERQMVLNNASLFFVQLAKEVDAFSDETKLEVIDLFKIIFQVCGIQGDQAEEELDQEERGYRVDHSELDANPDAWLNAQKFDGFNFIPVGEAGLEKEEYPA